MGEIGCVGETLARVIKIQAFGPYQHLFTGCANQATLKLIEPFAIQPGTKNLDGLARHAGDKSRSQTQHLTELTH